MGTAEVLTLLRPARNTDSIGPYSELLSQLSTRIPAGDLPSALSWGADRVQDGEDAFGDLLPRLVRRGWESAASPGVREPLARLTAGLASHPGWPRWPTESDLPWLGQNPAERRTLAVAVAGYLAPGDAYSLLKLGLLSPVDLGWMLRELPGLPAPARDTIARCVSPLARHPGAAEARPHPGHGRCPPRLPVHRVAAGATQHRLRVRPGDPGASSRRTPTRPAGAQPGRHERSAGLMAALDDAGRDPGCWWLVARWLAADDAGNPEAVFSCDLTTRPGWDLLSGPQRQDVLDLGVRYLAVHRPQPSRWAGRNAVPADHADPDWQGVYLLTTLARHDQERLASLGTPVWQAWAPAIVGARSPANDDDARARCRLTDLAPAGARQAIADAAVAHLDAMQEHGGYPTPYQLYAHLCPSFTPRPPPGGCSTGAITATTPGSCWTCSSSMPREPQPQPAGQSPSPQAPPSRQTPAGGLRRSTRASWSKTSTPATPPQARSPCSPRTSTSAAWTIPTWPCSAACSCTAPRSPATRPLRLGVHTPDPGYQVRRQRGIVLATLADHGQAGFFEELAARHDPAGHETITWHLREARSRATDSSYPGLPPRQLLHLLSRTDARLVRHDHDLLEVVIAQLGELQREITELRHYRFLWDSPGPGGTPKERGHHLRLGEPKTPGQAPGGLLPARGPRQQQGTGNRDPDRHRGHGNHGYSPAR